MNTKDLSLSGPQSSLSSQEKKEALRCFIQAMTPRQGPGYLLFPAFRVDSNGCSRPMILMEEFAGGKVPDDLIYLPGFQRTPVPVDHPDYLSSITYLDPLYNLPAQDRYDLHHCREHRINGIPAFPIAPRSPFPGNSIILSDPDFDLVDVPQGGMLLRTPEDEFPIANFSIYAVERRLVYGKLRADPVSEEYELTVRTRGQDYSVIVRPADIPNTVTLIQKSITSCTVSTSVSKAQAIIANHVRNQLYDLPVRHYIRRTGFIHLQGQWVYAHDGIHFPGLNLVFETGRTIGCDTSISVPESCQIAFSFLEISQKQELVLPLFLMAHLATLFNLFCEAGYAPKFLIFLSGRSGSLKTATVLCLFQLYLERPTHPDASFKDTFTAHEKRIGEANSTVVVIDDYRPPVTASNGQQNLEKLESVIRHVGDQVGKARSNAFLGQMREFIPSGCVVVTGEDTGGSQSSLLRCCLLSIAKGDIDGSRLKPFQDHPLWLMTHMYHFLVWCGTHGDEIIHHIRSCFEGERFYFSETLTELRLADAAATMMLTAQILAEYAVSIGGLTTEQQATLLAQWRNTIRQVFVSSEISSQEQNPVTMYLLALFEKLERKEIHVARDLASYDPTCHIGYADGDSLWLWTDQVYYHVRQFWQQRGTIFPLTQVKMSEHLADAGLIEVSFEARGTAQKRLFSKKSALPNHPRLMVLNEVLARQYFDNAII